MTRIEFGYAANIDTFWCAKKVNTINFMLCGKRKGWMPPTQHPFTPTPLCPDCKRILAGGPELRPVAEEDPEGTCPVCVGRAPLDEAGLIAPHMQWLWPSGKPVLTQTPCSGAGELPEVEQ